MASCKHATQALKTKTGWSQSPLQDTITTAPIFGNKWVWNDKKLLKRVSVDFDKMASSPKQPKGLLNQNFIQNSQIYDQEAISNFCEEQILLPSNSRRANQQLMIAKSTELNNSVNFTSRPLGAIQTYLADSHESSAVSRNFLKPAIKSSFFWSSIKKKLD